jgi:hypothetical protein
LARRISVARSSSRLSLHVYMDPRPACAFGALGGDDTRVCGARPASHAAAASASTVKQPRPAKREILPPPTRRPYRARGAKRVDRFSPSTMRGMTRRKAQLQHSRVSLRPCEGPCDPRIAFRRAIAAFLFEGPCFRVLGRTNESPSFRTGFRLPSPAPVQPFPAEPRSGPGR